MSKHPQNLVWMDLEMTGLIPERDKIIEIATIITDADLRVLAEGPVIAIYQPDHVLASMDAWNTNTHMETGLTERVMQSEYDVEMAEKETLDFIKKYVPANAAPLCGNSIGQDRRFLYPYMPTLSKYLHYRNIDVSSLKELAVRWKPEVATSFRKNATHKAIDDVRDSIKELRHYREHFINEKP
ncbi:MAG: oligoribonuclease [Gammaproteobacteria bacterium]|jgi:oligoribonuclease